MDAETPRAWGRILAVAIDGGAACAFTASLAWNVHALVTLDDLQSDRVNPHDASRRIARSARAEASAHGVGVALCALRGRPIAVVVNAPLMWWHWNRWREGRLSADATEIFAAADAERVARGRKLAFLACVVMIAAYAVTHAVVHSLMTKAGREALAKILREASHSPMYHMF